jgi:hypothetical protein
MSSTITAASAWLAHRINTNTDTFFNDFNGASIVLTDANMVPYDQKWTAETNPLDTNLHWSGFTRGVLSVPMAIGASGVLTSGIAGEGLYVGEYFFEIIEAREAAVVGGGDKLIVNMDIRLRVPNKLDDGTDVSVAPNAITTVTGVNVIFLIDGFPVSVANEFFDDNCAFKEACNNGTFEPSMLCAVARGGEKLHSTAPSTAAWTALGMSIFTVIAVLVLLITVGLSHWKKG